MSTPHNPPLFFPSEGTEWLAPDHTTAFCLSNPINGDFCSINEYICCVMATEFYCEEIASGLASRKQHIGRAPIIKLEKELGKGAFMEQSDARRAAAQEAVKALYHGNRKMADKLLETGDERLVFASKEDRVLGVGFEPNDTWLAASQERWGENALGEVLMKTREELRQRRKEEIREGRQEI